MTCCWKWVIVVDVDAEADVVDDDDDVNDDDDDDDDVNDDDDEVDVWLWMWLVTRMAGDKETESRYSAGGGRMIIPMSLRPVGKNYCQLVPWCFFGGGGMLSNEYMIIDLNSEWMALNK